MTQPGGKLGPVSIGGSEVFGNSAQGIFETLADIQTTAKGSAEWVDGLPTGSGQSPDFAHDHRGGVWGRPLGVGHSFPMTLVSAPFNRWEAQTFLNVPDVTSPTGEALATIGENGGYQLADFYVYHAAGVGTKVFNLSISVWAAGVWSVPSTQTVAFVVPGAGAQWTQCTAPIQLPAGLVRLSVHNLQPIGDWNFSSLVIPQR
jgi:hypothetical protein